MAKLEEPFDDVKNLFDEIIVGVELDRFVTIKVLCDDTQKAIGKITKANELIKYFGGVDLVIIINQRIFDQLTDLQQRMVAEELLAGISWDMDKDRLIMNKGDVNTYSGILRRYGYDNYEVLQESIRTLYAATAEQDA
jgi:hypothetical protein